LVVTARRELVGGGREVSARFVFRRPSDRGERFFVFRPKREAFTALIFVRQAGGFVVKSHNPFFFVGLTFF